MKKFLSLLLFALPAFGAYNHVRPVAFHPAHGVTTDLTNYPATFAGTYFYLASSANGGGVLNASGYDIVFTSDSGCTTKLNFERVGWSATTGNVEFHVQVPTLSHTADTTVYLCYGNSAISTDQQNAAATWDANYNLVQHFPNGTTLSTADSTGNLTLASSGTPAAARGQIDGGMWLHNPDSTANTILSAASPAVATSGAKTFEAWINADKLQSVTGQYTGILTYGKTGNVIYSLSLLNGGSGLANTPIFEVQNTTGSYQHANSGMSVYPGGYYHIAGTVNGSNVVVYVNGIPTSNTFSGVPETGDSTFSLFVGRDDYANDIPQRFFNGVIDEVRVSNIARSADWIATEYANQSSPSTFYTVGPESANSSNISKVSVVSATNTQAVLQFSYISSPSSCRVQVADNVSFTPVVHDTDTYLFLNADMVNRDSANIIVGNTAKVVEGKRGSAFYGLDGNRYSRALEQNKVHYYQITCGGGVDTYIGSFRTAPVAMGDTHLDGIPADSAKPGEPLWPTPTGFIRCNTTDLNCSTARRDTQYIDPQTGILIQHLIMPSDSVTPDSNIPAPVATGTLGWTISFGTAGNTSSPFAATITGSTNPISIGAWTSSNSRAFNYGDALNANSSYVVPIMLQFNIQANLGNAACTASSTSPDCRMDVCVTTNWTTCAPNAQVYQQQLTTTPTNYTFGSGQPYDVMQKVGKRIWAQYETSWRGGQVTCDGSTTITRVWDGATFPPEQIAVGSYIWIDTVGFFPVTSNIDALHLTIGTTCSTGTHNTNTSAFGVLVWKETSSADTLTLGPATSNDLAAYEKNPQYNSGYYGAPNKVTLANGDPGGVVQMRLGSYSIDLNNGKVQPFMPAMPASGVTLTFQSSSFDNLGNLWAFGNDKSLIRYTYQGDYSAPLIRTGATSNYPIWDGDGSIYLPTCSVTITNECFQPATTITQAGQTLDVLLAAFDSRFNSNPFSDWRFTAVEEGKLIFDIHWAGSHDTNYFGWIMIFDPLATSNVNGAFGTGCVGQNTNPAGANYLTPGCIVAATPGWTLPGAHWLTEKEIGQMLQPGWMALEETVNAFGAPGGGPAVANKVSSATPGSCPTNPFSLTSCVTFTVDGDPYDLLDGKTAHPGILGTYAIGDFAILTDAAGNYPNPPDSPSVKTNAVPLLQLVQISGTTLTFGCVYGSSMCLPGGGTPIDVNPQLMVMYSSFPAFVYPWAYNGMVDILGWNYANDPHGTTGGDTVAWDISSYNAHGFNGNYLFSQGGSSSSLCSAPNGCYNNQNFQGLSDSAFARKIKAVLSPNPYNNVTGQIALSSFFSNHQGFNGWCGNNNCQTHPDYSKLGSDPLSAVGLDGRPFMGVGSIPDIADISKVSGAQTLYKVANISAKLKNKIFDTFGSSGHRVLRNLSGPGSVIADGSGYYYTMCQALLPGECYAGSLAGDFYVNIPYLYQGGAAALPGSGTSACYYLPGGEAGSTSDNWMINDLCISDAGMEYESYTRYTLNTFDMQGGTEQTFGHLFSSGRNDIYTAAHPATNITTSEYNQYYYFPAQYWDGIFATMLMKAPPVQADSGNRTTFTPVTVNITQISGADHAAVQFWYSEYNGNCSPNRNDSCLAVSSTVNTTTPFYWSTESSIPLLSCSTTCSIAVPALPEHVLYYRVNLYSGSTLVSQGPTQIIPVQ